jgi:drug/metabolite transporter (DMT)-like permease
MRHKLTRPVVYNKTTNAPIMQALTGVTNSNVFELMEAQLIVEYGQAYETVLVVLVLTLLTGIIVNVLLVWAVHIKFPWLLTPWLVYFIPVILAYFIAPVLAIYSTKYVDIEDLEAGRWTVLFALIPIFGGLLTIYFWLVVNRDEIFDLIRIN